MPFSTDTKWPQYVLNTFENHLSDDFGPYDMLLHYALEDSFTLFVTPQTTYHKNETSPSDPVPWPFSTLLVGMTRRRSPVFFAEIILGEWANDAYCRENAHAQMCRRFNQILPDCPIPRLYGLSLLGTSLCVYCADKVTRRITCHSIPDTHLTLHNPDEDILPSDYLQGHWNIDILSPEGLAKMQEIIGYIKAEVGAANVVGQ
jgi:hypothetical protein